MKGGKRPGAGRKPGSKNQRTAELARRAAAEGITPLEYMLDVMREPQPTPQDGEEPALFVARYVGWRERAFEAAKAAAPYVHPKLATMEHSGPNGAPIQARVTIEFVGKAP